MTQQSHSWAYTLRKPDPKETRAPQCSSQHCLAFVLSEKVELESFERSPVTWFDLHGGCNVFNSPELWALWEHVYVLLTLM